MRLTIRGWAVVVVVLASVAMAWQYGPRALNAVVTPLLVVLVAGLVVTARADRPEISRPPVDDGFVGDQRTVDLEIETNATVAATVHEPVGDGLSIDGTDADAADDSSDAGRSLVLETILEGDDRFSYEIRLTDRGERQTGPLTITISDVFGLVERRFSDEQRTSVLVYPRVHDLAGAAGTDFQTLVETTNSRARDEFDHLREYRRGDALSDVNWKAAAKRPDGDLVVTEYARDENVGSALIAADCPPGWADELATAVASVTTHLLEGGVNVGLNVPDGDYEPDSGAAHYRELLAQLATLEAGELEERQRQQADVLVQADAGGTRVVVNGRVHPFGQLTERDGTGWNEPADHEQDSGSESGVAT